MSTIMTTEVPTPAPDAPADKQATSTSRYISADRQGFRLGAMLGSWESMLALLFVAAFTACAIQIGRAHV